MGVSCGWRAVQVKLDNERLRRVELERLLAALQSGSGMADVFARYERDLDVAATEVRELKAANAALLRAQHRDAFAAAAATPGTAGAALDGAVVGWLHTGKPDPGAAGDASHPLHASERPAAFHGVIRACLVSCVLLRIGPVRADGFFLVQRGAGRERVSLHRAS